MWCGASADINPRALILKSGCWKCRNFSSRASLDQADQKVGLQGGSPDPSVPGMGRILLDERSQPEPMTVTVAKRKA